MIATDGKAERDSTFEMSTAEEKRAAEDQRIAELMGHGSDGRMSAVLTHRHRCHAAACHGLATGPHLLASLFFVSPLVKWFSAESSRTFRKVRNASAQVIIQLSETMTGIEAVQAYYREPRNQEIFT